VSHKSKQSNYNDILVSESKFTRPNSALWNIKSKETNVNSDPVTEILQKVAYKGQESLKKAEVETPVEH